MKDESEGTKEIVDRSREAYHSDSSQGGLFILFIGVLAAIGAALASGVHFFISGQ